MAGMIGNMAGNMMGGEKGSEKFKPGGPQGLNQQGQNDQMMQGMMTDFMNGKEDEDAMGSSDKLQQMLSQHQQPQQQLPQGQSFDDFMKAMMGGQ